MPLARDAVLTVMETRGTPVCAGCLSETIGLAYEVVFDALEDLELRSDYLIGVGVCSECGEHHRLVWPRQAA